MSGNWIFFFLFCWEEANKAAQAEQKTNVDWLKGVLYLVQEKKWCIKEEQPAAAC